MKKDKAKKQEAKAKKQEAKAQKQEAKNKKKQEKKEAKAKKQKDKQAAKAKKNEAKAAAKAKKNQAKAAKKGKAEGEEQTKKRLNLKVVIPLLLVIAAAGAAGWHFFLSGDDGLQPPEAYAIAEESTIVLDSFLEEGGKLKAIDLQLPEGEEEAEEDKDDEAEETDENAEPALLPIDAVAVYTYTGVTPAALENYLDALLAEEESFTLVDDTYAELEERPVFGEAAEESEDAEESEEEEAQAALVDGTFLVARESGTEGRLFQLRLTWTANGECTVEVSCPEASFPAEPMLNSTGALDYIKAQNPADLGLPGESMSEYNIYNQDGVIMIDGEIFRKFNVYELDETTNTNSYVGEYLISSDGRSIYKRDSLTGEMEQVK